VLLFRGFLWESAFLSLLGGLFLGVESVVMLRIFQTVKMTV
jgi:hypothetical protein